MTQEIKFNPAGTVIATTYVDGTTGLWDVATGKSLHRVTTGAEELYTVDWSPDGKLLVTAGHDAKIILWDATDLKPLKELEAPLPTGLDVYGLVQMVAACFRLSAQVMV